MKQTFNSWLNSTHWSFFLSFSLSGVINHSFKELFKLSGENSCNLSLPSPSPRETLCGHRQAWQQTGGSCSLSQDRLFKEFSVLIGWCGQGYQKIIFYLLLHERATKHSVTVISVGIYSYFTLRKVSFTSAKLKSTGLPCFIFTVSLQVEIKAELSLLVTSHFGCITRRINL